MNNFVQRYGWLKAIQKVNRQMSFLHRVEGVDISRCFEYTQAYKAISTLHGGRVLDVGSYRSPFPIFLAQEGYTPTSIDLTPSVAKQLLWSRRVLRGDAALTASVADGTRLPLSDGSFDAVVCISTIEHLPNGGESRMMREIGRVLKLGGLCFVSVPYATTARVGHWGRWFQQWFDLFGAEQHLIHPSGLNLIEQGFLIGDKVGRWADCWYRLPRYIRHVLSWSHILLFPKAFEMGGAGPNDARVLWLLFIKE